MKIGLLTHYYEPLNTVQVNRVRAFVDFWLAQSHEVFVVTRYWQVTDQTGVESGGTHNMPASVESPRPNLTVLRLPLSVMNPTRKWPGGWRFWKKGIGYTFVSLFWGRIEHDLDFTFGADTIVLQALQKFEPDVLITSIPTYFLAPAAIRYGRSIGVPVWIDLRDLHDNNITRPGYKPRFNRRVSNYLVKRSLQKSFSQADFFTATTSEWVTLCRKLYKAHAGTVLQNGYEGPLFEKFATSKPSTDVFRISYLGALYKEQINTEWLIGIRTFLEANPDERIEIQFIGLAAEGSVAKIVRESIPDKRLIFTGRLPRIEALSLAASSHAFLLLHDKGFAGVRAKTYEYLALRRTILVVPEDDSPTHTLFKELGVGTIVSTHTDVCKTLTNWHKAYLLGESFVLPENPGISNFSRSNQIKAAWEAFLIHVGKAASISS